MKRSWIAVVLPVFIAGCTSTSESVPGPSGATINQAKCNGNSNVCLKQAAKTCNGPYQVVDSSSNAGGLLADIIPGPVIWYKMTYQCGPSDGRLPTFQFRGPEYRPPVTATTTCNGFGNTVTCRSY